MNSQTLYTIIFAILIAVQIYCACSAFKSNKPIGKYTGRLNLAIILPILANIIIIWSFNETWSIFGYYFSYIGMMVILMTVTSFTTEYCKGVDPVKPHKKPIFLYVLGFFDIAQLLLGFVFNHVFTIELTTLDGLIYYADYPLIGLTIHRIINYIIFGCNICIYIVCAKKTSRLYREKFLVILGTLIAAGVTQGFFIASRTPIDKSILVHGCVGLVVYYFSIRFRPLRLLDTLLSSVASDMNDAVIVFDDSGKAVWANNNAYEILQVRWNINEVKSALLELFGDIANRGDAWSEDIYIPETKSYYNLEKKSVKSNYGLDGSFLVIRDNTEQRKALEKELYESTHDSLTGLFNMDYLYKHIKETLKTSNKDYCVLYMNIKNFKIVNDIFGHKFGDRTLKQIAAWLKETLKSDAIYGRLIGDTFGIFMPMDKFDENVFLDGLSDFVIRHRNMEHQVSVHIGVYEIVDKKLDVSVMFDRAHMALMTITDSYKTCIKVYDDTLRQEILEEQKLALDLTKAIEENQIRPYLQPITDKDGNIVGAEALARWIHPELGFLSPGKFIPSFEKNGMIVEVDNHIWEETCKILHKWKSQCCTLFISINVSPKDFYFINVVQTIQDLVNKYGISPKLLRIEITETAMMFDSDEKLKIFNQLRDAGFIVEMDDFGSGYSSLNMLKKMPVDILKIDMNFLDENGDNKSKTIVKNVINLSNELNMTALTEGVETESQYDGLKNMGCSLFQGYYFAKPMPIDEFEQFVKDYNRKSI